MEGLSLKELEKIYSVNENALKVRLFRARQRVLNAFEATQQKHRQAGRAEGLENMDQFNNELNSLFAKYRAAVPDPDASANFMPELWRKIEARQSLMLRVRKLTQVFVGAAAAVCLLFAMIQVSAGSRSRPEVRGNYVDVLAAAYPADSLAALGIVPHDSADPRTK